MIEKMKVKLIVKRNPVCKCFEILKTKQVRVWAKNAYNSKLFVNNVLNNLHGCRMEDVTKTSPRKAIKCSDYQWSTNRHTDSQRSSRLIAVEQVKRL